MSSSYPLLRPIDICDQCDDLFEMVAVSALTPHVRTLRFVKLWNGVRVRVHPECVDPWRAAKQ